jgi:hypothetical protein
MPTGDHTAHSICAACWLQYNILPEWVQLNWRPDLGSLSKEDYLTAVLGLGKSVYGGIMAAAHLQLTTQAGA